MKLFILLVVIIGLFGCKGKEEKPDNINYNHIYDRYTQHQDSFLYKWDSVMTTARPFLDSIDWSKVDTTTWSISSTGTISHHIPKIKSNDVGMSTKPTASKEYSEIFKVTEDTTDWFITIDTSSTYEIYEMIIRDTSGDVASRQNGKWAIGNCERALEVWYITDSTRNADYEITYKRKLKNKYITK